MDSWQEGRDAWLFEGKRQRIEERQRIEGLEIRIQQLEEALREALQMVEDAGRAYVNYSPERLKHLGSLRSSEAPKKEGEDG